ncbi:hypothetical protein SLS62_003089 [Diatrype stigma]|uniref:Uncharacterized protein n=1 Tax=Diatrype stigma TaxID=117547 RepID=A0AAN9UZ83_9PEZI
MKMDADGVPAWKVIALLATLLATSVSARPSNLTRPDISNSDAVLIVKEHQSTGGEVWAVACTGQLTLALLQCGFDGGCSTNGTVMAQNPVCLEFCSCATEGTLDPFKTGKLKGLIGRAHNDNLLTARSINQTTTKPAVSNYTGVGRLSRVLRANLNSTQTNATTVNSTLPNTTLGS